MTNDIRLLYLILVVFFLSACQVQKSSAPQKTLEQISKDQSHIHLGLPELAEAETIFERITQEYFGARTILDVAFYRSNHINTKVVYTQGSRGSTTLLTDTVDIGNLFQMFPEFTNHQVYPTGQGSHESHLGKVNYTKFKLDEQVHCFVLNHDYFEKGKVKSSLLEAYFCENTRGVDIDAKAAVFFKHLELRSL